MRWLRDPETAIAAGPPTEHLRRWDALSARRRLPALGGLDGHQPGVRVGGRVRSPLSHRSTFDLLRTHLLCERPLTGVPETDWRTVLGALRSGAAWLTCPYVAPAAGARLWGERPDGSVVAMGAESPSGRCLLRVRLPRAADLTVVATARPGGACTRRRWISRLAREASTASRPGSGDACGSCPTPFTCDEAIMSDPLHHHQHVSRGEPAWVASAKHGWELVFLRDWHPALRDPLDLVRLSFVVGALVFAVKGDWDAAVRLLLPGVAVFAVRAIDVPRPVDWVFCAAMFFQGWGNALHLFSRSGGTTTASTSRCR
jgi:hypothetical protein